MCILHVIDKMENNTMQLYTRYAFLCLVTLCAFSLCPSTTLAGGEGDGEVVYSETTNFEDPLGSNLETATDSNSFQTGNVDSFSNYTPSTVDYDFDDSNSVGIKALDTLRNTNSFSYEQDISISGSFPSSYSNRCGFGLYGNVNNANTELKETVELGFLLNSKKCADEEKMLQQKLEVEEKAIKAQERLGKVEAQVSTINNCIDERSRAVSQKHNPNAVCRVPDMSEMELLFLK